MQLLTIGHSNLKIEAFMALLQQHDITAIADVRSHPYSRYLPHFNQTSLKTTLHNRGIRYVFLGRELGARPSDLSCYSISWTHEVKSSQELLPNENTESELYLLPVSDK